MAEFDADAFADSLPGWDPEARAAFLASLDDDDAPDRRSATSRTRTSGEAASGAHAAHALQAESSQSTGHASVLHVRRCSISRLRCSLASAAVALL